MLSIKQICEQFNEVYGGETSTFYREDGVAMFLLDSPDSDSYCFGDVDDFDEFINDLFEDEELRLDYLNWYLHQVGKWEICMCEMTRDGYRLKTVANNTWLNGLIAGKQMRKNQNK